MKRLCLPSISALFVLLFAAGCATQSTTHVSSPLARSKVHLSSAKTADSESTALSHYLAAAESAMEGKSANPVQSDELYLAAVAGSAELIARGIQPSTGYELKIRREKGTLHPNELVKVEVASEVPLLGMTERLTRTGVGLPMVAFVKGPANEQEFEPKRGFTLPATAILRFPRTRGETKSAEFALVRPDTITKIEFEGKQQPVAADFTAPIVADLPGINPLVAGLKGLFQIQPQITEPRLVFLEPYDPKKLPVIFVHGLLSTPFAWENVANQVNADPEFRKKCQIWFFGYSTGNPILYSTLLFREKLAKAEQVTGMRGYTLVGHSMGGILSRMQVVNTGRVLWDTAFEKNADLMLKEAPEGSLLRRALISTANPRVERIIFVATPHRGSTMATLGPVQWVVKMIKLPVEMVAGLPELLPTLLATDSAKKDLRLPTSIEGLSPNGLLSRTIDKLKINAPYHSIIGIRNAKEAVGSSDGVVPYSSSHLEGAESEITVPTDHGAFNHPRAVAEIRRILLMEAGKR